MIPAPGRAALDPVRNGPGDAGCPCRPGWADCPRDRIRTVLPRHGRFAAVRLLRRAVDLCTRRRALRRTTGPPRSSPGLRHAPGRCLPLPQWPPAEGFPGRSPRSAPPRDLRKPTSVSIGCSIRANPDGNQPWPGWVTPSSSSNTRFTSAPRRRSWPIPTGAAFTTTRSPRSSFRGAGTTSRPRFRVWTSRRGTSNRRFTIRRGRPCSPRRRSSPGPRRLLDLGWAVRSRPGRSRQLPSSLVLLAGDSLRRAIVLEPTAAGPWISLGVACWTMVADPTALRPHLVEPWDPAAGSCRRRPPSASAAPWS